LSPRLPVTLLVAAFAGLTGCQSTQSKSAELEEKGETLLLDQTGGSLDQESTAVEVLRSAVLSDKHGAAVAVELKNNSARGLRNVPIIFEIRDSKGKMVFANDTPGLDPTLTSIAYLEPGEQTWWVHDQVFAKGGLADVEVKVGETEEALDGEPPDVTVEDPTLEVDPVSGIQAVGDIQNNSGRDLTDVYYYAVATRGDEIVAAGRGASLKLKAEYKRPREYHIFFIGESEVQGADDLSVTTRPTSF
jgi:hypothetical protein